MSSGDLAPEDLNQKYSTSGGLKAFLTPGRTAPGCEVRAYRVATATVLHIYMCTYDPRRASRCFCCCPSPAVMAEVDGKHQTSPNVYTILGQRRR